MLLSNKRRLGKRYTKGSKKRTLARSQRDIGGKKRRSSRFNKYTKLRAMKIKVLGLQIQNFHQSINLLISISTTIVTKVRGMNC